MNYSQCLEFLYANLPMYHRDGSVAFKKDLTNTLALAAKTGNPHQKIRAIHIAGTNGKGSVSHLIAAVLQAEGYKVGLYTSPHYVDFRERIKINGQWISKNAVIGFIQRMMPYMGEIRPSFFELTVVMAFDYFVRKQVDFAIIETGLGGRLDSTNVVAPLMSVITNISLDHQSMLGDTLDKIAREKAGIIKPDTPVVIGEENPVTDPVFRNKANDVKAPIFFAGDIYEILNFSANREGSSFILKNKITGEEKKLFTGLTGSYQRWNLRTALAAMDMLSKVQKIHFSRSSISYGLREVKNLTAMVGRWQILQNNPLVILDGGHNPAGLRETMQQLSEFSPKKLRIIFGVSKDKDVGAILELLPQPATYYWCAADLPRSLPSAELAEMAKEFGLRGKYYSSVLEAFRTAKEESAPDNVLFIGGSIFVVGEVLQNIK